MPLSGLRPWLTKIGTERAIHLNRAQGPLTEERPRKPPVAKVHHASKTVIFLLRKIFSAKDLWSTSCALKLATSNCKQAQRAFACSVCVWPRRRS